MIEFLLIYLYTMAVTLVIGLYGRQKQRWRKKLPLSVKILLVIPVKGPVEIPLYLIAVHGGIQIFSILGFLLLKSVFWACQSVQILYGLGMVGVAIPLTIGFNLLARRK